jgi:ribosomal protein S3
VRQTVRRIFDDLFNRPFCDRAFIHFRKQLTAQTRVGKQVRIEVKDGRRLFLRARGKALAVATKLIRRLFQRAVRRSRSSASSSVEAS